MTDNQRPIRANHPCRGDRRRRIRRLRRKHHTCLRRYPAISHRRLRHIRIERHNQSAIHLPLIEPVRELRDLPPMILFVWKRHLNARTAYGLRSCHLTPAHVVITLSCMERSTKLNMRLTEAEKAIIRRAAERAERTMSDWVRLVAIREAEKELKE